MDIDLQMESHTENSVAFAIIVSMLSVGCLYEKLGY